MKNLGLQVAEDASGVQVWCGGYDRNLGLMSDMIDTLLLV